jgi:hypothetical protein
LINQIFNLFWIIFVFTNWIARDNFYHPLKTNQASLSQSSQMLGQETINRIYELCSKNLEIPSGELILKDREPTDDQTYEQVVDVILKNTKYVHFSKFKDAMERLVDDLLTQFDGMFYMLAHWREKIGSELWIMFLMWPKLAERCLGIIDKRDQIPIDDHRPIVVLDDAIYSGCNICGMFDDFTYKKAPVKNPVWIVVYSMCASGYLQVKSFFESKGINFGIMCLFKPKSIMFLLKESNIKLPEDYLYDRFGCESETSACTLYFDHKISNKFGSFPALYSSLLDKKPSRAGIKAVKNAIEALGLL